MKQYIFKLILALLLPFGLFAQTAKDTVNVIGIGDVTTISSLADNTTLITLTASGWRKFTPATLVTYLESEGIRASGRVTVIATASDTTTISGALEGDIAMVGTAPTFTSIYVRDNTIWRAFAGGGGGSSASKDTVTTNVSLLSAALTTLVNANQTVRVVANLRSTASATAFIQLPSGTSLGDDDLGKEIIVTAKDSSSSYSVTVSAADFNGIRIGAAKSQTDVLVDGQTTTYKFSKAVGTSEYGYEWVRTASTIPEARSIETGKIAQSGATSGQVIKWNGTDWAPAADDASGTISDGAVTEAKIANDAVTAAKIATGAVGASELASTAVTPGTYGTAVAAPVLTIDADGRVTSATTAAITAAQPVQYRDWMQYAEARQHYVDDSIYYQYKNKDTVTVLYRISDSRAIRYEMQGRDEYRKLAEIGIVKPERYLNKDSTQGTWSGTSLISSTTGGKIFLTFTGTEVSLNYYRNSSRGRIQFILDGNVDTVIVDGYSPTEISNTTTTLFSGLSYGQHSIVGTVITANPSSSGSNFSIWNYISGNVVLRQNYNFVVGTFENPTYTQEVEKITASGSNMEYAITVSPLGSGLTPEWIPFHGSDAVLETGDSMKVYIDGRLGTAVSGITAPFRRAKKIVVSQEVDAWHRDSLGVAGRQVANIQTRHAFGLNRCDVTGEIKWLRRTLVTGYSFMLPISTPWGDTLTTDQFQKIELNSTTGINEAITGTELVKSAIAEKNNGNYAIIARINDDVTLRKNQPFRANPPQFLEHRNDNLTQKWYNSVYSGDTTDVGERLNISFSLFVLSKDTSRVTLPAVVAGSTADGSETKVTAGSNVTVTGAGTVASPYVIAATSGGSGISGLTTNLIPKATSSTAIGNGSITDDGTRVSFSTPARLHSWTTAGRPASPSAGDAGWNTSNNNLDIYNGTAASWESFVKSANGSGAITATYIPYGDANGRLTVNAGLRFPGTSTGIVVSNFQINGAGTSVSEAGQGLAVEGSARTIRMRANGGNASSTDVQAFLHSISSITRTASTNWRGWLWDAGSMGAGSSIVTYTMHVDSLILSKGLTTLIGRDYNPNLNGQTVTNHYAHIWRTGNLGVNTAAPSARLHIAGGTAALAPLVIAQGTAKTSPADGEIEHISDNLTFTAGTTRFTLAKTLTATATLDFNSTSANSSADLTVTVTGAATGDAVHVGIPSGSIPSNSFFTAWVSAADTVTIRFSNNDNINAADPASGTFRVVVTKY